MRIDALYVKRTQMPCSSPRPIVCSNQIASLCLVWLLFGWVWQQLMHRLALACSPSGKKERPPHVPFRSHSNWSPCSHYNPKPKTFVFEPFFLDEGCQKLARLCRSVVVPLSTVAPWFYTEPRCLVDRLHCSSRSALLHASLDPHRPHGVKPSRATPSSHE